MSAEFWLDTRWACGLVRMDAKTGRILRGGAPIFNKLAGQVLLHVVTDGGYRLKPLSEAKRPEQGRLF